MAHQAPRGRKQIISGPEARRKICQGIREVVKAAAVTLGPHGHSVIIYNKGKGYRDGKHHRDRSHKDNGGQDPHNHHHEEQETLRKLFPRGILMASDGFTVARHVQLTDRATDLGARLITDLAADMNVDDGDGRTTAMLLAWGMVQKAMIQIEAGEAVTAINRGINQATDDTLDCLQQLARPVYGIQELRAAATTATGDAKSVRLLLALSKKSALTE